MRTKIAIFALALLAGWVSVAAAQQATGQQPAEETQAVNPWHLTLYNWVDFGVRGTKVTGDEARFERYRDARTGPFVDRFRFDFDNGSRTASFGADNIGYRDERFFAQFQVPGKFRMSAEWNQIPQWWAQAADATGAGGSRSPYAGAGTGVQTLPSGVASQIQAASSATQQAVLKSLLTPIAQGNAFDTRGRRDTFTFNMQYMATNNLALNANLSTAKKSGDEPWSVSLGFAGATEVAAPVDTRTTDLNAGAEWANDKGMARISYDGSWFSNKQESMTVDSPLRGSNPTPSSSTLTRTALWPTNHANTVTGAAAVNLPAHSRLMGTLSVGNWLQDTTLLPYTINPAIPSSSVPLPRSSAEGDIRRVMTNISFTTRPANFVNVSARYRLYDFNDRTPEFVASGNIVEYDAQVEPSSEELVPAHFSHRYNTFEAEATITSLRVVSFGGGYRLNRVSYTDREVGLTKDNAVFATVDTTSLGMVSLHGVYEHARRRASDFFTLALTDLPDSGEYPGLRRYDIADRDRDSFTGMLQVMPVSFAALSGSVTIARDKYPNEQLSTPDAFGLQNAKDQGYSLFLDVTPRDGVIVSGGYGYQKHDSLQRSRRVDVDPATPAGQAQQANPLRDWELTQDEKVHYIAANLELANLFPKSAVRITYDFNKADSPYLYTVGSALNPTQVLPPVTSRWHTATFDFRYFIRRNLAAGITYWYERFNISDFALGPQIEDNVAVPGIVLLGYGFRPYTANSVWGRLMFVF